MERWPNAGGDRADERPGEQVRLRSASVPEPGAGRRWPVGRVAALVAAMVTALASCTDGDDPGGPPRPAELPGDPVAVSGTTDQDLRIQLRPTGRRAVEVLVAVECDTGDDRIGTVAVPWEDQPLRATVADDGTFGIQEDAVVEQGDGNEDRVALRIEGAFSRDGTASGTLEGQIGAYDAQLDEDVYDCTTGTIGWRADEAPGGEHAVVELGSVALMEAAGDDVLVVRPDGASSSSLTRIDGRTARAGEPVPLRLSGAAPDLSQYDDVVVAGGGLWVPHDQPDSLVHVDPTTGGPTVTVDTGRVVDLVVGHDALWTLAWGGDDQVVLAKRDVTTGEVTATAPDADDVGTLAVGPEGIWFLGESSTAEEDALAVRHVDPETLEVTDQLEVEPPGGLTISTARPALASPGGELWVLAEEPAVVSLDPATGESTTVELPSRALAMAVASDALWTTHHREGVIRRIEDGEITRTVDVPTGMDLITVTDDGTVWLASTGQGVVVRVDPAATG